MWELIVQAVGATTSLVTTAISGSKNIQKANLQTQEQLNEGVINIIALNEKKKQTLAAEEKQKTVSVVLIFGCLIISVLLIITIKNKEVKQA